MRFPVRCLCLVASLLATSLAAGAREPDALAEIPLGIEAVTGYRSEYIHRGFKFAGALVDFQAEAEIALSTHLLLNVGGWFATGVGGADFEEAAGFLGFRQETDELTLGVELTLRRLRHSEFESGFDLAPYVSWHFNDDFAITGGAAFDTGADGFYAFVESVWSKPLGDSAFIKASGGLSAVADYYGRSGLNDLYGRVSYTYAISRNVALSPFVKISVPMKSHGEAVRTGAGIWFEVTF